MSDVDNETVFERPVEPGESVPLDQVGSTLGKFFAEKARERTAAAATQQSPNKADAYSQPSSEGDAENPFYDDETGATREGNFMKGPDEDSVDAYSISNNENLSFNDDGTVTMTFNGVTSDSHAVQLTTTFQTQVPLVNNVAQWTEEQKTTLEQAHEALQGNFENARAPENTRSQFETGFAVDHFITFAEKFITGRLKGVGLGEVTAVTNEEAEQKLLFSEKTPVSPTSIPIPGFNNN